MILSRILKRSHPFLNLQSIIFKSGTYQKLLIITNRLSAVDSLKLNQLCQKTLQSYIRQPKKGQNNDHHHKSKKNVDNVNVEHLVLGPQESLKDDIIYLYNTVSDANIGYLKGDIHSDFVYNLSKIVSKKAENQMHQQITEKELKNLLSLVTLINQFRLPKMGIKSANLEDSINFYHRQMYLQRVSNELSVDRYDNILETLIKLGKISLSEVFKNYTINWFAPLCSAIIQQQNKCKQQQSLNPKRSLYGAYLIKIPAQKITTLCISEVLKSICNSVFKNYERKNPQLEELDQEKQFQYNQFDTINYNSLCLSLSRWILAQEHYDQAERKFKIAMRAYDEIFNARKMENKQERNKQKKLGKIKQEGQAQILEQVHEQEDSEKLMKNQKFKADLANIQKTYSQKYIPPSQRSQALQNILNNITRNIYKQEIKMSEEAQYELSSMLIYLVKQIFKVKNKSGLNVPLLTLEHKYKKHKGQVITQKRLRVNEYFLSCIIPLIEKQADPFLHLDRSLPTIMKPLPWFSYEIGGYYVYPSQFMRFSQCKIQERLIKYGDLKRVFNVIDKISQIPWKINKKVLEVVEALWIEGGKLGQIPKRYSDLIAPELVKLKQSKDKQTKRLLKKKIQELRDEHSLRSDFKLKLQIACAFGKVDRFYYPHNVDFRGRVYPIPPHLNHIGNDLSRGLLLFADGKKLGPLGVKWLKIHCANLMGKQKSTVPEKMDFIAANIGLIHAIAQDPLKNRQWLSNEDSWQSLAAIFQLSTALKHSNPQQYVSCLHIHQDGSCNGLQHYAALGRDTQGAYQVNLGPTERPGDVYTHVANMVIREIQEDIANPDSKDHELAKKLRGNIKRKTIKQTVMTSVYGVTFIGARDQIYRQLKDQAFLKNDDEEYAASIYVAKLTLKKIANLFSQAHCIKTWLIECSKMISKNGNPMGWITPMGLPVVQPYRKQSKTDFINSIVQKLKMMRKNENVPVNKLKQMSAFPPNFVHSLDSTHMMYTAEQCLSKNITFAAVHDSYWTHAATVEQMNEILRQQFIRLHEQPLLQNLKASLEIRYPQLQFPDIPKRGDFDLKKIKESVYFFS